MQHLDLTGAVLDGRYRVIEPVAEGAMGVVYRAERIKLGRIVAVKILHDSLPSALSSRKRFEIEAMAMAKLEHPHCVAVLDVGLHGDHPFVVMDFVSGQNLKEVIAHSAPLPIPRAIELVRQLLSGLAHAHEHGIIHRDIKPANIVLSQKAGLGDHVKILDFGLARLSQDSSLTTGIVVGTPSYMAPEQIRGATIDGRVDVYATGILLFELLTGQKPFSSAKDDPIEVCTMHLKDPVPRLGDILPGQDFGELEAVIARALAKVADERYASAVEFAAALDALQPRRQLSTPQAGVPITPPHLATPPVGIPVMDAAAEAVDTVPDPGPASAPSQSIHTVSSSAIIQEDVSASPASPASSTPLVPSASPAPLVPPASSAPSAPDISSAETVAVASTSTSSSSRSSSVTRRSSDPAIPRTARRPATSPPRVFGKPMIGIAAAAGLAVVVVIALVARGGSATEHAADAATVVLPPPGRPDPAGEAISRANELAANGRQTAALELLLAARKTYAGDARLSYLAGKLYFERFWWSDGLKQLRDTVRIDPAYRADPELVRTVLRGFNTTPRYNDELASFLRDELGPAAKAGLEETSRGHPNPAIRSRAANELKRYR